MCPLLDFPKYYLLALCKNWLELNEVCSLDTSFCSQTNRCRFLNLFQGNDVSFSGNDKYDSSKYLYWLMIRSVKVDSMKFTLIEECAKLKSLESNLLEAFSDVKTLHLTTSSDIDHLVLHKLVGSCLTLDHLTIFADDLFTANQLIELLFDCSESLSKLHIEIQCLVTAANMQRICDSELTS